VALRLLRCIVALEGTGDVDSPAVDVDVHSYTSPGRIRNDTEVEKIETEMARGAR